MKKIIEMTKEAEGLKKVVFVEKVEENLANEMLQEEGETQEEDNSK